MAAAAKKKDVPIVLPKLNIKKMAVNLTGDTRLVCHKWSEKAKKQIRDKQMKKAKQAKETRNPEQDFLDSLYEIPGGGYGFPATAFKKAAVDACSHVSDITKVQARGAFHIEGDLVQILGCEPQIREDMVRVGMGTTDLRYRGEFVGWHAVLKVRYNSSVLSEEQIANLFNTAGFAIGVGEFRPQKNGSWGMFHVEN